MSATFAELANVKVGEVERPKPTAVGHYSAQFTGPAKEHKARSGNVALRFPFKVTGALDDVDADDLEACGGLPDKEFALDFWMSPDARYRFTEFAKAMGVSEELNIIEAAEALIGAGPFQIEAKQETDSEDPNKVYTRWDNPAPLD